MDDGKEILEMTMQPALFHVIDSPRPTQLVHDIGHGTIMTSMYGLILTCRAKSDRAECRANKRPLHGAVGLVGVLPETVPSFCSVSSRTRLPPQIVFY